MSELRLKNLKKVYPNGVQAINDLSFAVGDGELLVIVGPSGCGKSTLLRVIAGLDDATSGEIYLDGKSIGEIPPKERSIGMVSQSLRLGSHLTVYENLAFGLKLRKASKTVIEERVKRVAAMLNLTDVLTRKPKTLSSGQRQRVALGRVIAVEPKLFLLDEPLSNLDQSLRTQMRSEIAKLHARLKTSFVYVTHDQVEAMTMGTRIVVLKDGFMQQVDTPRNLYDYPVNRFVASFFGSPAMNLFEGATLSEEEGKYFVSFGQTRIALPKSVVSKCKQASDYVGTGKRFTLGIRPEDVHEDQLFVDSSPETAVSVRVELVEQLGAETLLHGTIGDKTDVVAKVDSRTVAKCGDLIDLAFDARHVHLFDAETELSLLSRDEFYEESPENREGASFIPLTPAQMRAILKPAKDKKKK